MPVGVLHIEDRPERLDAGIGEEDIDLAEGVGDPRGRVAQSGDVALVELPRRPGRAFRLDQPPGFVQFGGCGGDHFQRAADRARDVDPNHRRAFACEGDRGRTPDAPGRARDDGDLTSQTLQ